MKKLLSEELVETEIEERSETSESEQLEKPIEQTTEPQTIENPMPEAKPEPQTIQPPQPEAKPEPQTIQPPQPEAKPEPQTIQPPQPEASNSPSEMNLENKTTEELTTLYEKLSNDYQANPSENVRSELEKIQNIMQKSSQKDMAAKPAEM